MVNTYSHYPKKQIAALLTCLIFCAVVLGSAETMTEYTFTSEKMYNTRLLDEPIAPKGMISFEANKMKFGNNVITYAGTFTYIKNQKGEYYGKIVLPSDASSQLLSILNKKSDLRLENAFGDYVDFKSIIVSLTPSPPILYKFTASTLSIENGILETTGELTNLGTSLYLGEDINSKIGDFNTVTYSCSDQQDNLCSSVKGTVEIPANFENDFDILANYATTKQINLMKTTTTVGSIQRILSFNTVTFSKEGSGSKNYTFQATASSTNFGTIKGSHLDKYSGFITDNAGNTIVFDHIYLDQRSDKTSDVKGILCVPMASTSAFESTMSSITMLNIEKIAQEPAFLNLTISSIVDSESYVPSYSTYSFTASKLKNKGWFGAIIENGEINTQAHHEVLLNGNLLPNPVNLTFSGKKEDTYLGSVKGTLTVPEDALDEMDAAGSCMSKLIFQVKDNPDTSIELVAVTLIPKESDVKAFYFDASTFSGAEDPVDMLGYCGADCTGTICETDLAVNDNTLSAFSTLSYFKKADAQGAYGTLSFLKADASEMTSALGEKSTHSFSVKGYGIDASDVTMLTLPKGDNLFTMYFTAEKMENAGFYTSSVSAKDTISIYNHWNFFLGGEVIPFENLELSFQGTLNNGVLNNVYGSVTIKEKYQYYLRKQSSPIEMRAGYTEENTEKELVFSGLTFSEKDLAPSPTPTPETSSSSQGSVAPASCTDLSTGRASLIQLKKEMKKAELGFAVNYDIAKTAIAILKNVHNSFTCGGCDDDCSTSLESFALVESTIEPIVTGLESNAGNEDKEKAKDVLTKIDSLETALASITSSCYCALSGSTCLQLFNTRVAEKKIGFAIESMFNGDSLPDKSLDYAKELELFSSFDCSLCGDGCSSGLTGLSDITLSTFITDYESGKEVDVILLQNYLKRFDGAIDIVSQNCICETKMACSSLKDLTPSAYSLTNYVDLVSAGKRIDFDKAYDEINQFDAFKTSFSCNDCAFFCVGSLANVFTAVNYIEGWLRSYELGQVPDEEYTVASLEAQKQGLANSLIELVAACPCFETASAMPTPTPLPKHLAKEDIDEESTDEEEDVETKEEKTEFASEDGALKISARVYPDTNVFPGDDITLLIDVSVLKKVILYGLALHLRTPDGIEPLVNLQDLGINLEPREGILEVTLNTATGTITIPHLPDSQKTIIQRIQMALSKAFSQNKAAYTSSVIGIDGEIMYSLSGSSKLDRFDASLTFEPIYSKLKSFYVKLQSDYSHFEITYKQYESLSDVEIDPAYGQLIETSKSAITDVKSMLDTLASGTALNKKETLEKLSKYDLVRQELRAKQKQLKKDLFFNTKLGVSGYAVKIERDQNGLLELVIKSKSKDTLNYDVSIQGTGASFTAAGTIDVEVGVTRVPIKTTPLSIATQTVLSCIEAKDRGRVCDSLVFKIKKPRLDMYPHQGILQINFDVDPLLYASFIVSLDEESYNATQIPLPKNYGKHIAKAEVYSGDKVVFVKEEALLVPKFDIMGIPIQNKKSLVSVSAIWPFDRGTKVIPYKTPLEISGLGTSVFEWFPEFDATKKIVFVPKETTLNYKISDGLVNIKEGTLDTITATDALIADHYDVSTGRLSLVSTKDLAKETQITLVCADEDILSIKAVETEIFAQQFHMYNYLLQGNHNCVVKVKEPEKDAVSIELTNTIEVKPSYMVEQWGPDDEYISINYTYPVPDYAYKVAVYFDGNQVYSTLTDRDTPQYMLNFNNLFTTLSLSNLIIDPALKVRALKVSESLHAQNYDLEYLPFFVDGTDIKDVSDLYSVPALTVASLPDSYEFDPEKVLSLTLQHRARELLPALRKIRQIHCEEGSATFKMNDKTFLLHTEMDVRSLISKIISSLKEQETSLIITAKSEPLGSKYSSVSYIKKNKIDRWSFRIGKDKFLIQIPQGCYVGADAAFEPFIDNTQGWNDVSKWLENNLFKTKSSYITNAIYMITTGYVNVINGIASFENKGPKITHYQGAHTVNVIITPEKSSKEVFSVKKDVIFWPEIITDVEIGVGGLNIIVDPVVGWDIAFDFEAEIIDEQGNVQKTITENNWMPTDKPLNKYDLVAFLDAGNYDIKMKLIKRLKGEIKSQQAFDPVKMIVDAKNKIDAILEQSIEMTTKIAHLETFVPQLEEFDFDMVSTKNSFSTAQTANVEAKKLAEENNAQQGEEQLKKAFGSLNTGKEEMKGSVENKIDSVLEEIEKEEKKALEYRLPVASLKKHKQFLMNIREATASAISAEDISSTLELTTFFQAESSKVNTALATMIVTHETGVEKDASQQRVLLLSGAGIALIIVICIVSNTLVVNILVSAIFALITGIIEIFLGLAGLVMSLYMKPTLMGAAETLKPLLGDSSTKILSTLVMVGAVGGVILILNGVAMLSLYMNAKKSLKGKKEEETQEKPSVKKEKPTQKPAEKGKSEEKSTEKEEAPETNSETPPEEEKKEEAETVESEEEAKQKNIEQIKDYIEKNKDVPKDQVMEQLIEVGYEKEDIEEAFNN